MTTNQSLASVLASMDPVPRAVGSGRPARFTAEDVHAMYEARKRGFSWSDVNRGIEAAGMEGYKRSSTLAQVVHDTAERLNITPHKTSPPRTGRAKARA